VLQWLATQAVLVQYMGLITSKLDSLQVEEFL
jgi:hypothetical protein